MGSGVGVMLAVGFGLGVIVGVGDGVVYAACCADWVELGLALGDG